MKMKVTATAKMRASLLTTVALVFLSVIQVARGAPVIVKIDDLTDNVFYTVSGVGRFDCEGESCLDQQVTVAGNVARSIVHTVLLEPGTLQSSDDFVQWSVGGDRVVHFCFRSDNEAGAPSCTTPTGFVLPTPTNIVETNDYILVGCTGSPCPADTNLAQFFARSDVPEPSTWLLLATAFLGLVGCSGATRKSLWRAQA
jgi:hypothetical protein